MNAQPSGMRWVVLLGALAVFVPSARASDYYRHVIFDNSLTAETYVNSRGTSNGPSHLEVVNGRLPVDTARFVTPPGASVALRDCPPQTGGPWPLPLLALFFAAK